MLSGFYFVNSQKSLKDVLDAYERYKKKVATINEQEEIKKSLKPPKHEKK